MRQHAQMLLSGRMLGRGGHVRGSPSPTTPFRARRTTLTASSVWAQSCGARSSVRVDSCEQLTDADGLFVRWHRLGARPVVWAGGVERAAESFAVAQQVRQAGLQVGQVGNIGGEVRAATQRNRTGQSPPPGYGLRKARNLKSMGRRWRRLAAALGLPEGVTPHGLRKHLGTEGISVGLDATKVADQLGNTAWVLRKSYVRRHQPHADVTAMIGNRLGPALDEIARQRTANSTNPLAETGGG